MRSISQFRAKALADLSKKMSRCKKGSRQWRKYKDTRNRLRQTSNNQLEALEHKTTKEIVAFLEAEKVTHLVIGNVSGIERGTKKNEHKKRNILDYQTSVRMILNVDSAMALSYKPRFMLKD